MLVLVLGTWGLTLIGTFCSALTVNIRLREVMLPMLTYPALVPVLMGSMQLTMTLMAGKPIVGDMANLAETAGRLRPGVHRRVASLSRDCAGWVAPWRRWSCHRHPAYRSGGNDA